MGNFNFHVDKNKFIWENSVFKIQFSRPSIETSFSYSCVSSIEEIFYNYYCVDIFCIEKLYNEDTDETTTRWKKITSTSTYDFPCITQLQLILESILKTEEPITDGQKISYMNGKIGYRFSYNTEGFGCDDFYELSRIRFEENAGADDEFTLYAGCSLDVDSDENSIGFRTPYLTENDIIELKNCVDSFIEFEIQTYNKQCISENELNRKRYEIIEDRLFIYSRQKNKINKEKINHILQVGDFVSLSYANDAPYYINKPVSFHNEKIYKILKNSIVLNNGYEVDINTIVYLSPEISDERLHYNLEQIADDFLSLIPESVLQDFKEKDNDKLLERYYMAVINRSTMCRDEHGLERVIKEPDNVKNAKEHVKTVINLIKNKIKVS